MLPARILLLLLAAMALCRAEPAPPSKRVVIVANASDPGSLRVAQHYAARREIPPENIVALPMSLAETIRWPEFITTIFQPLQDELIRRKWIDAVQSPLKDDFGRTKAVVAGHTISYLVVCRGVPLRIEHEADWYRLLPPLTDRAEFQTNAGAVDSELALLSVPSYPISAFVSNPLFANPKPTVFDLRRVVKVSRLDGPSVSSAMALVDSALAAERDGLAGRAYVDIGGPHASGDDWFRRVEQQLIAADFDLTVDRSPSTLSLGARFDAPVLYFGWYAADLTGPFTAPDFRFPAGAVALHLHSFSARSLNSFTHGWTGPLVARGVAATVGNVHEPYLEFTHHPHRMLEHLLAGGTWGDAACYSMRALSWQAIAIGDPLYRPFARSRAAQWRGRNEVPDTAFPYVVLREIRRLQREGTSDEALREAEEALRSRPSAPLALKLAELREAAGDRAGAVEAAAWFEAQASIKTEWVPLADQAAQLLARLEQAERAVTLYMRLLKEPNLPLEQKLRLLSAGAAAAEAAGKQEAQQEWKSEADRLKG